MGRRKLWPPRPHVHRASGQERVRIDGKDHYLGSAGSAEAKTAYADLIRKLAGQPEPSKRKAGFLVTEVVERWNQHALAKYDPAGREAKQYLYACEPLIDICGKLPADGFGANELEEVRDEMIGRGWNRAVVNRRVIRLRTVFRWAERKGLVPPGAWAALRALEPLAANDRRVKPSPGRKPCDWPTLAKVCRMCAPTPRDMLLFQWWTGARSGETRLMRVGEIDRKGDVWTYTPAAHKNAWRGHQRAIPIGPRAQAALRKRLADRPADAFVFESSPGHCYQDDSYARAVARACERAGVTGLSPYSCRHACRLRVTRELGLDAARAMLGHKSLGTTNEYAAGVDLKSATEVARKLG